MQEWLLNEAFWIDLWGSLEVWHSWFLFGLPFTHTFFPSHDHKPMLNISMSFNSMQFEFLSICDDCFQGEQRIFSRTTVIYCKKNKRKLQNILKWFEYININILNIEFLENYKCLLLWNVISLYVLCNSFFFVCFIFVNYVHHSCIIYILHDTHAPNIKLGESLTEGRKWFSLGACSPQLWTIFP